MKSVLIIVTIGIFLTLICPTLAEQENSEKSPKAEPAKEVKWYWPFKIMTANEQLNLLKSADLIVIGKATMAPMMGTCDEPMSTWGVNFTVTPTKIIKGKPDDKLSFGISGSTGARGGKANAVPDLSKPILLAAKKGPNGKMALMLLGPADDANIAQANKAVSKAQAQAKEVKWFYPFKAMTEDEKLALLKSASQIIIGKGNIEGRLITRDMPKPVSKWGMDVSFKVSKVIKGKIKGLVHFEISGSTGANGKQANPKPDFTKPMLVASRKQLLGGRKLVFLAPATDANIALANKAIGKATSKKPSLKELLDAPNTATMAKGKTYKLTCYSMHDVSSDGMGMPGLTHYKLG